MAKSEKIWFFPTFENLPAFDRVRLAWDQISPGNEFSAVRATLLSAHDQRIFDRLKPIALDLSAQLERIHKAGFEPRQHDRFRVKIDGCELGFMYDCRRWEFTKTHIIQRVKFHMTYADGYKFY